jgi:hypothetical protein
MIIRKVDGSNDWNYGQGNADYARDNNAIMENIKTRLLSWVGDCFFALLEGVDWKSRLDIGQQQNLQNEIKGVILQSYGVLGVNKVNLTFSGVTRLFNIQYSVDTIFGNNIQAVVQQTIGG